MMISPEYYRKTIEEYELPELIKERDKLIREIRRCEKNIIRLEERMISPSPEVVYQCNNEYLIQVVELINQRFNTVLYSDDGKYEEDEDLCDTFR